MSRPKNSQSARNRASDNVVIAQRGGARGALAPIAEVTPCCVSSAMLMPRRPLAMERAPELIAGRGEFGRAADDAEIAARPRQVDVHDLGDAAVAHHHHPIGE